MQSDFADDRDIDAVLRGRKVGDRPDLDPLVMLVEDLRTASSRPATPNAALAAMLELGLPDRAPVAVPGGAHSRTKAPAVRWASASAPAVRWMRLRTGVKAGALATVAALSFTTAAAAAGALPDPIQEKMSTAVATVTPWRIPRPDGKGIGPVVRENARQHGQAKNGNNGNGNSGNGNSQNAGEGKTNNGNANKDKSTPQPTEQPVVSSVAAAVPSASGDITSPAAGRPVKPSKDAKSAKPAKSPEPAGVIDQQKSKAPKTKPTGKPTSAGSADPARPGKPLVSGSPDRATPKPASGRPTAKPTPTKSKSPKPAASKSPVPRPTPSRPAPGTPAAKKSPLPIFSPIPPG